MDTNTNAATVATPADTGAATPPLSANLTVAQLGRKKSQARAASAPGPSASSPDAAAVPSSPPATVATPAVDDPAPATTAGTEPPVDSAAPAVAPEATTPTAEDLDPEVQAAEEDIKAGKPLRDVLKRVHKLTAQRKALEERYEAERNARLEAERRLEGKAPDAPASAPAAAVPPPVASTGLEPPPELTAAESRVAGLQQNQQWATRHLREVQALTHLNPARVNEVGEHEAAKERDQRVADKLATISAELKAVHVSLADTSLANVTSVLENIHAAAAAELPAAQVDARLLRREFDAQGVALKREMDGLAALVTPAWTRADSAESRYKASIEKLFPELRGNPRAAMLTAAAVRGWPSIEQDILAARNGSNGHKHGSNGRAPAPVVTAPAANAPRATSSVESQLKAAKERLSKTGSVRDRAQVIALTRQVQQSQAA